MSVLDRSELEQSHLADLHAIASELGIEGYRRLGRDALIDAILAGNGDGGGEEPAAEADDEEDKPAEKPRGRGRRLRLRRDREEKDEPAEPRDSDDGEEVVLPEGDDSESAADESKDEQKDEPRAEAQDEDVRAGVLDILPGGSGFMRADAFVHAREDV